MDLFLLFLQVTGAAVKDAKQVVTVVIEEVVEELETKNSFGSRVLKSKEKYECMCLNCKLQIPGIGPFDIRNILKFQSWSTC